MNSRCCFAISISRTAFGDALTPKTWSSSLVPNSSLPGLPVRLSENPANPSPVGPWAGVLTFLRLSFLIFSRAEDDERDPWASAGSTGWSEGTVHTWAHVTCGRSRVPATSPSPLAGTGRLRPLHAVIAIVALRGQRGPCRLRAAPSAPGWQFPALRRARNPSGGQRLARAPRPRPGWCLQGRSDHPGSRRTGTVRPSGRCPEVLLAWLATVSVAGTLG